MQLQLSIKKNNIIALALAADGKAGRSVVWQDRNDLSRHLLANLDRILRNNQLGLDNITGYTIISEVPRKWTTYRIAEITFKTLGIASQISTTGLARKKQV